MSSKTPDRRPSTRPLPRPDRTPPAAVVEREPSPLDAEERQRVLQSLEALHRDLDRTMRTLDAFIAHVGDAADATDDRQVPSALASHIRDPGGRNTEDDPR